MTSKKNEIHVIDDLVLKNMSGAGFGVGMLYIAYSIVGLGTVTIADGVRGWPLAKSSFSRDKS